MAEKREERIVFIDLMRALAVFMMVQGHTIDAFLLPELKSEDSLLFSVWNTIRGFTAPIFMFSAGVAFTYLFRSKRTNFSANPRVKKGVNRFFILLLLAYFLRFPTYHIFDLSGIPEEHWKAFYTIDALHLIAFGLLFIMLFMYVSEKIKINEIYLLLAGALLFLGLQILFEPVKWTTIIHPFFAAYLYSGSGSFFPLFPWVAYLLCGAALGSKIASAPVLVKSPQFGIRLIVIALAIFTVGKSLEQIKFALDWGEPLWVNAIYWFSLRISIVLGLNGVMSIVAHNITRIPRIVRLFGTYSLLIYVVHIVILYGNTWIPGLNYFYNMKFSLFATLMFVALMFMLMGMLVLCIDYYKKFTNKKIQAVEFKEFTVELSD